MMQQKPNQNIEPTWTTPVEKDVERTMISEGSADKLGSCHRFWELKKEKLKEIGINWKSPKDMNPSVHFD